MSHPDKYSNVLSLNDQTRKRIYTNPSLATFTKSKHSLGFKVEPQIVQSITKINFDEWKQEEKFSTQTLHRPTGPPKRFVNLGMQRNTKKKVFTLETFIQKKTDLRFTKGAQKVQGIEEHQLKIN